MFFTTLHALLTLGITALAAPQAAKPAPAVDIIYQFPTGTAVENSAILPNGSLIVSLVTEASLYRFDVQKPNPTPYLAYQFANRNACTGLAQPAPDVLAAVAGVRDPSGAPDGTRWAVLLLKLRDGKPATLLKMFKFPQARLLNGMTALPGKPNVLLIADSGLGLVWRLDTATGAQTQLTDPLFQATDPAAPPIGVNGVHAVPGSLFFTNSNRAVFGRFALSSTGASAGQPAQALVSATVLQTFDDFALAPQDATVYFANVLADEITRPNRSGGLEVVAGSPGDPVLRAPTSVQYVPGKGKSTLYVTTAGAPPGSVPQGKVLRIRL